MRSGIIIMLVACGLLTANDAMVKLLVEALPVGQIIGIRSLFALATILLLAPLLGGVSHMRAKNLANVSLCAVLLVFNILLFPFCLRYLPLADAIILAYTSPVWVVILAPLLIGEKSNWQQWLAVLVGFAGACLVIKPQGGNLHWAVLIPLVVAVMVGLRDIVTRKIASEETALSIVAYANLFAIVAGFATVPTGWVAIESKYLLLLFGSGALFSISQLMIVEGFRRVEATVLSTFKYSSILYAALFGYLFWGEAPDIFVFVGALMIVISGLLIVRYRHRPLATVSNVLPRDVQLK